MCAHHLTFPFWRRRCHVCRDCSETPAKSIKIFVNSVDDHPIIRQGLARLIDSEADIEVCGGAESVVEALEQVKTLRPDLVVVNISLKDSSGIEVISRLRELDPEVKTLVWSVYDEKAYAERALRAGAQGYVNKQEPIHEMVGAIRRVLQGEIHLCEG